MIHSYWNFFSGAALSSDRHLLILNQPIPSFEILTKMWNSCNLKVCADGGANRLFQTFTSVTDRIKYKPDYIVGDLDSIKAEILEFYRSNEVTILKKPSQYSTDFQKCIELIFRENEGTLYVLGGLTGRIDHTISSFHTLLLNREKRIILISADSMAFLLVPGMHDIHSHAYYEGDTCGIFPLNGKALVITKGLQWDVGKFILLIKITQCLLSLVEWSAHQMASVRRSTIQQISFVTFTSKLNHPWFGQSSWGNRSII